MRHAESGVHLYTVIMATVSPRRALVYKIQKRLSDLSTSQLLKVASSIDDGSAADRIDDLSEPELYDLIIDYIKSEKLANQEDEGMTQLLLLDDMVSDLVDMDTGAVEAVQTVPLERGGSSTIQQGCSSSPQRDHDPPARPPASLARDSPSHPLYVNRDFDSPPASPSRDVYAGLSTGSREPAARDSVMPVRNPATPASTKPPAAVSNGVTSGRVSLPSSMGDQVLRFNDVAALLPRREFKLHGGQISDVGSEMSFSCLCKQIDEGMHEGFTESEVIRTVIKITKPGTFKEMLVNKGDLTVDELKRFLRAHIRDKNSTELFQELSNAKQHDKESPQQFLYRMMGLKQRILFESEQSGAVFSYDKRLVQGTFLHTLYQGLNEKNNYVRHDLKPLLTDWQVNDDFLLDQITKSTSEEAERLKRLGSISKPRPVTVNTAQLDNSDSAKQVNVDAELQANRAAIKELTVQVSSLTKHLAQMVKSDDVTPGSLCPPKIDPQTPATDNRGRCSDCVQQGKFSCPHCFRCGQAGHRAIGCLQRKQPGNGLRPLERGNQ